MGLLDGRHVALDKVRLPPQTRHCPNVGDPLNSNLKPQSNQYLFTVTGVKKMKWFLSLTRCHFQPQVTEGHKWLEMAPSVKLKPLNCLHQPDDVNEQ